jgi:hypothetical protein
MQLTQDTSEPDTDPNWLFKAFCAFQDFNNIRKYVKGLWESHRDGKADLVTVSLVTEVAFHIIEAIECETLYVKVRGKKLEPIETAEEFDEHCCDVLGQARVVGPGPTWKIAEWVGLPMLVQFELWRTGRLPEKEILRDTYGKYLTTDRSTMTDWQKYCEDCTILAHIIPVIVLACVLEEQIDFFVPLGDKVTKTIQDLVGQGVTQPRVSLLFGLQILLDCHIALRAKVERPCTQMRIVAKIFKGRYRTYGNFLNSSSVKDFRRQYWEEEDERDMGGLRAIIWNLEEDVLGKAKPYIIARKGQDASKFEDIPDTPFSTDPVLSGLYVLGMTLHVKWLSSQFADHWWYIMPMTHLYNALR